MLIDGLCHLKHVHTIGLKDSFHLFIAEYISFVTGVLQVLGMNVLPQFLSCLGSRQLVKIRYCIPNQPLVKYLSLTVKEVG